jgi:cell division protein FtsL
MDTAIICGLISAASAIIVSVITAVYNNKLLVYRLEQLEKKMDKHNNVIERVTVLETKVADLENDGK